MSETKLQELIFKQVKSFYEKGYAFFDLIEMGYFSKEDILEVQSTCMESYYKYFTDREINRKDVEIDLELRCPLDSDYKIGNNWCETH